MLKQVENKDNTTSQKKNDTDLIKIIEGFQSEDSTEYINSLAEFEYSYENIFEKPENIGIFNISYDHETDTKSGGKPKINPLELFSGIIKLLENLSTTIKDIQFSLNNKLRNEDLKGNYEIQIYNAVFSSLIYLLRNYVFFSSSTCFQIFYPKLSQFLIDTNEKLRISFPKNTILQKMQNINKKIQEFHQSIQQLMQQKNQESHQSIQQLQRKQYLNNSELTNNIIRIKKLQVIFEFFKLIKDYQKNDNDFTELFYTDKIKNKQGLEILEFTKQTIYDKRDEKKKDQFQRLSCFLSALQLQKKQFINNPLENLSYENPMKGILI